MKRIVLLGATGSIGSSACDVIRSHADAFRVAAIAVRSNRAQAEALGREFGAPVFCGAEAALQAVEAVEADLALVATVGLSGLAPTLAALEKGMDVALATKEVMVAAGELVVARARAVGARLIPVDSEHSAIFQCLQGHGEQAVESLTLTASGGPFLDAPVDLAAVTPEQALHHPRWKMGPKVTVDSATMMNKGFEILEASGLFGVPVDRIHVVVHPESIVHSLVTFADGATLAQLSPPDMRVPIQYAFTWPDRLPAVRRPLDLAALGALTFRAPDETRFPCLRLVKEAAARGGVKPAALSAADEIAVVRFLAGDIRFTDIPRLVEAAVLASPDLPCDSLHNVMAADAAARKFAQEWNS
ncbi:MAG: 1-deoxy-D-xylulose-5-phosphate reductoisomerase [Kiritimatiellia bacterium]